ncbi:MULTISPECIES: GGDEF domain-containing protein [Citromicrobium]|uniref:GGDEF domain-containing protein n=2 Tax=Sphingomonadaceae TaxID=41297 RepID=UPI0009E81E1C|nr:MULTISPECIES: GGDEF domain-containing protein [Citromicrobium]
MRARLRGRVGAGQEPWLGRPMNGGGPPRFTNRCYNRLVTRIIQMDATSLQRPKRFKDRVPVNIWLRFAGPLQELYDREYSEARVAEARIAIFVGLALYNVYNFTSLTLLTDYVVLSIILRVGVITPVALALAWAIGGSSPQVAERLISASVFGAFLVPAFLLWITRDPLGIFTFGEMVLVVIYANMLLALRFPHAVLFTAGAMAISLLILATRSGLEPSLAVALAIQMVTACAFSLFANYRHERRRCADFMTALLATQEASDAKAVSKTYLRLSLTDALTRLPNRRLLTERLERWLASRRPVALMMIDIDHFKPYNDTLGHTAGDDCLQMVANRFSQIAAQTKGVLCARYGGEEFTFALRDSDQKRLVSVARTISQAIEDLAIPHPGRPDGTAIITVSVGVAQCRNGETCAFKDLVNAADRALYAAKTKGRNRVAMYEGDLLGPNSPSPSILDRSDIRATR